MNIYLGNIQFDEIREKLGFELTEEDRKLWEKYYNSNADLSGKENCFHVFDMPRCIHFKGDETGKVILKMFSRDKLVQPMGKIQVYQK